MVFFVPSQTSGCRQIKPYHYVLEGAPVDDGLHLVELVQLLLDYEIRQVVHLNGDIALEAGNV